MASPDTAPAQPDDAAAPAARVPPDASHAPRDDAPPAELAELFLRLAKRLRRGSTRGFAPLGLTPSQAHALRTIAHAKQPLPIGQLAARLDIVPRSATGVVDALERAGLVAREPDPSDRRTTLVCLTDEGRGALRSLRKAWREGVEELFVPLSPADRAELARLLATLDAALPAPECGPRRDAR